jgi:AraC-like DNA-binding protein/CheY-like chemotaxis protein
VIVVGHHVTGNTKDLAERRIFWLIRLSSALVTYASTCIMDERSTARFELVAAAYRFVLNAVPFRHPNSRTALSTFLLSASTANVPGYDLEIVLLRTLSVLNRYAGNRLPTMVDQYLSKVWPASAPLDRFREIVEDVLRYHGIEDPLVRRAIAMIEARYTDATLGPKALANDLGVHTATLARAFNAQTQMSPAGYFRNVRLDRGAALLAATDRTVKEVWVAVGYNHASNFDRDFKERFGVAPRKYRAGVIRPTGQPTPVNTRALMDRKTFRESRADGTVLIIDDDEGTRDTIGRYLELEGYAVFAAATGGAGLREAERIQPHVVLLDYHLPDIDGLQCLQALCHQNSRARLIIFSADWDLQARAAEFALYRATVLSKLCALEDISSALA